MRTLVLGHALTAALSHYAQADSATGRDALADLSHLEALLLAAAQGLADRASTQKLAVLVAVEDAVETVKASFDAARAHVEQARRPVPAAIAA